MVSNVRFTNLDFEDTKTSLRTYLEGQTKFRDYDFEGSNMSVLLDVLSYNTFLNNYYTNQAMSEMFIDSVQFRDNIMSHAKELNYLPRSRRSSRIQCRFEVFPTQSSPSTISIPAKEEWSVTADGSGISYVFSMRDSINIKPTNGRYVSTGTVIYEGQWIEEFYTSTGSISQNFVMSNANIDTTSMRVFVRDNESSTSETEYVYKNNLYGVAATDKVYYLQPSINDKYEIRFGQDSFGTQPTIGNIVRVEYQVSSGDVTNGIRDIVFSGILSIGNDEDYSTSTNVTIRAEGGAERESIESIRFNAPNSIQIQNRAITETDYKNLITANFPEITTVSVYGGEKIFPPQFGRVYVAVDTKQFQGVSDNTKEKLESFLANRSAIAIEPIVINAKFMYLEVNSLITYNINNTNKSAADIQNLVKSTILAYSNNNLEQFGQNFRYSKLITNIDNSDSSIVSNDTVIRSVIDIKPITNQRSYFVLQFSNKLLPDVTTPADSELSNYSPCVFTSEFIYGEIEAYIQDNGSGQLDIVKDVSGVITFVEKNVGSVDYETGDVIVRYITIEDYDTSIKVYAKNSTKDINAPIDRIVFVRDEDIIVSTQSIRE